MGFARMGNQRHVDTALTRLRSLDLAQCADKHLELRQVLIFRDDERLTVNLSFVTSDGTCNIDLPRSLARALGQGILKVLNNPDYADGTVVTCHAE
jgi:hypothetical protein